MPSLTAIERSSATLAPLDNAVVRAGVISMASAINTRPRNPVWLHSWHPTGSRKFRGNLSQRSPPKALLADAAVLLRSHALLHAAPAERALLCGLALQQGELHFET